MGRMIRAAGLAVVISSTQLIKCGSDETACLKREQSGFSLGRPASRPSYCASSCTYLLAGGSRRFIAPWAAVGVHSVQTTTNHLRTLRRFQVLYKTVNGQRREVSRTLVSEKVVASFKTVGGGSSATYAKIDAYLKAMGIAPAMQRIARETPFESVHFLSPAEIAESGLATDRMGGPELIFRTERDARDVAKAEIAFELLRHRGLLAPARPLVPLPEPPPMIPVI